MKIAPFTLKVNIYLSNFNKYFLQSDIVRRIKKNPAKQDSPPAAGRASDILPFRRSAIRAERFLSYGNEVSYTIKMPCAGSAPKAQDLVFLFYWQALQLHQHEHIVDRANGVFEIPVAHADDDV